MSKNIETSGGIFTQHFIDSIEQERVNHPALKAETFTFDYQARLSERELESKIASAWAELVERWDVIEREFGSLDITALRQRWLRPLFSQLGYNLEFNRADLVLEDDMRFPISFLGRAGTTEFTVPVHTVLYSSDQTLETKAQIGRGIKAMAPHDMLQRYLNLSKVHTWGLLTDGVSLRLLRDYYHSYTRGYTEFDLQSIFSSRDYSGFRAMFRLLHASRFVVPKADESAPIAQMYEDALALGVAVGDKLRVNVQAAIESFANGFLFSAPGFQQHVQALPEGPNQLYRDILITIYRILFLLFAEQRGMLPGRGSLYHDQYSLTAFRTLAEQPRGEDHNVDLWEKLKAAFSMVEHGVPDLNIYAYNGALFSAARTPLLTPEVVSDAPVCRNDYFLKAIRHLTTVEQDGVLQRISYSDLSVEEIGSIYESLLEITPRVTETAMVVEGREIAANTFFLDPRGKGRKTTGSYYTPPALVNELIKSALEPVMLARLRAAVPGYDPELVEALKQEERQKAEEALLQIKVVDPACGSGAFLIAANNKLGLELARVRSGSLFPLQKDIQRARRDVLTHCIHGVDLNPMAVELCKVSLWINAAVEDAPLNFLDHHIQCGNSLVGATPELLKLGIPDEAYNPVTGDDKPLAASMKKRNRLARVGAVSLPFQVTLIADHAALQRWLAARDQAESKPALAEKAFLEYQASEEKWLTRLPYDLYCAAFFAPLQPGQPIPTTQDVRQAQANPSQLSAELSTLAHALAEEHRFFHWHLAFPEVFDQAGQGGFDVVLGNPPWEMINLEEKEYFDGKDETIVNAGTGAQRKKLIENLALTNPQLFKEYRSALFFSEALSRFLSSSGKYPLTSSGRINLYSVFAELDRALISSTGRAGFIVPSGLATDFSNRYFFSDIIEHNQLASLFDFENRKGLFQGVHRSYKFSLITLRGAALHGEANAKFAFFLFHPNETYAQERTFELSAADFALLNPNTRTCPIFRSRADADLTKKIYHQAPILINEVTGENPWGVSFKQGHFNMTSDSHLFRTREQLEAQGFVLNGNIFNRGNEVYLPLYEAKMFHQHDHRFARFINDKDFINNVDKLPTDVIIPRYWVASNKGEPNNFHIGFRNTCRSTDVRTGILSVLPRVFIGNNAPIIQTGKGEILDLSLLACLNSFSLDYALRNKIGGIALNFFIVEQIPTLSPDRFIGKVLNLLIPRVFELVFTAWDLQSFADEVWQHADGELRGLLVKQREANADITEIEASAFLPPSWARPLAGGCPFPPFLWDEERRFDLRCDLDALFGHLYNLTHDEFDYILETFPIVRRNDESQYGEYRTKRVILEKFDAMADDPMLEGACIPLQERVSVLQHPPQPQPTPIAQPSPQKVLQQAETTPPTPAPVKPSLQAPTLQPPVQTSQASLFEAQTDVSETTPIAPSDYTLYRCPLCEMHLPGFSLASHTQEVHHGKDPGYLKVKAKQIGLV